MFACVPLRGRDLPFDDGGESGPAPHIPQCVRVRARESGSSSLGYPYEVYEPSVESCTAICARTRSSGYVSAVAVAPAAAPCH